MPKCLNDSGKRYTGSENTPKGKGYVASAEKVGKRMKGTDGDMYVVAKKGGSKRWTKMIRKNKSSQMSPMSKKSQKRRVKKKTIVEEYSSSEEEEEYSSDEEDEEIGWKLDAAEERCNLSDVLCTDYLLASVASLAWSYFRDWYQRVKYGEDPYEAYEDISLLG
jgi:hypothetical protein